MFLVSSILIDERHVAYREVAKARSSQSFIPERVLQVHPELLVYNYDGGKPTHVY